MSGGAWLSDEALEEAARAHEENHTLRARIAELEEHVRGFIEGSKSMRMTMETLENLLRTTAAENARLRAALDPTDVELGDYYSIAGSHNGWVEGMRAMFRAIRKHAGLESEQQQTTELDAKGKGRCGNRSSQGLTCGLAEGHAGNHNALAWAVSPPPDDVGGEVVTEPKEE